MKKYKVCKICKNNYIVKEKNKCHEYGFCSYSHYKKTDEFKNKYKKTFIKNRIENVDFENMRKKEIDNLFHKLKSDSVKKSQRKRVKTIKNKGKNEFSRMTKLGSKNRKISFLINNNIINKNDIISNDEINNLFKLFFNSITNHGKKIKDGLYKKYGQNISKEFQRRYKKAFINFLKKKNIELKSLSIKEYKNELLEFNRKHRYNDVLQWKKTHIINHMNFSNEDVEKMTKNEICKNYSQYLCDRMKLVTNIYNGYRRTKKGYYIFKNINKKIFYRSSWEELFLKIIDKLILKNKIDDIKTPDYIRYTYEGINRKYYPDFEIIFKNNFKIIEIKPFSKVKYDINQAKFKSAIMKLKDNFIVLTEEKIFSDLEYEILKIIGD